MTYFCTSGEDLALTIHDLLTDYVKGKATAAEARADHKAYDFCKAEVQAYLIQNHRAFPEDCATWERVARKVLGTTTRTAAVNN